MKTPKNGGSSRPPAPLVLKRWASITPEQWPLCETVAMKMMFLLRNSAFCVAGEVQYMRLAYEANVPDGWLEKVATGRARLATHYTHPTYLALLADKLGISAMAFFS